MSTRLSQASVKATVHGPVRSEPIMSYAELWVRLRHDLRAQNPEWIDSDGNSPICDCYERRLAELIWRLHGSSKVYD